MIYFDNAATTMPCPEAVEAVMRALTEKSRRGAEARQGERR